MFGYDTKQSVVYALCGHDVEILKVKPGGT